jgi:NitT/TauT family transport system permease protein
LSPDSVSRRSLASLTPCFAFIRSIFSPFYPIRTRALIRGVTGIAVFLVLAQTAGWTGLLPRNVLPLTSTVLSRAVGLAGNGRFTADLGATLEAWAIGLCLTVIIAVPLGLLLGSVPVVRLATRAVVEFLRPIPSVALILLVSLIVGYGLRMIVTLILCGAIWPVLYNTMAGLDDVDPVARETLRAFGFSRLSVLVRVSLPSSAPFIATGIRIASSLALILDIAAGYVGGRISGPGIGAFIFDANSGPGNLQLVLAAAVWTGLLGLVLNLALTGLERRLLPWHRASLAPAEGR